MIEVRTGDVLHSGEFIVAHGCNTMGVMGAGIAKQVKHEFSLVHLAYRHACEQGHFRIGTAQRCPTEKSGPRDDGTVWPTTIYNLGTQKRTGADATPWGIFLSFANMFESMLTHDEHRVAIPRIGAGIGGLKWVADVAPVIREAQQRASGEVFVVVYDLPRSAQ